MEEEGEAEVTAEHVERGENSKGMLYLTPGLSHSGGSGKHRGGSHIGELPWDGSEGE